MTIMVKTTLGIHKKPTDIMVVPLIDVEPEYPIKPWKLSPTPSSSSLLSRGRFEDGNTTMLLKILIVSITFIGFVSGMIVVGDLMYKYTREGHSSRARYQCAISSTQDMDYVIVQEAPVTASWFGVPATEMRVYSSASDLISAKILNNLMEDMSIEDDVENIYVHDGPRNFRIVHDFNENFTSIISPARCFLMDMIRQFVMEPASLIASFRNESVVELSHAHSVFTAALPETLFGGPGSYPAVIRPCFADNKPVYRLNLDGTHVLHKRSLAVRTTPSPVIDVAAPRATSELPNSDFVQFSGRHLQLITVSNLGDVIKYEADNNRVQRNPKLAVKRPADE